jgi:mRNA degradation ribonuclease J1/J2
MAVKPRVLIPMHWQERADVAQEYVRKNRTRRVEMVALTRPGDVVVIGKRFDQAEDDAPMWHYQTITRSILEERESAESTVGEED